MPSLSEADPGIAKKEADHDGRGARQREPITGVWRLWSQRGPGVDPLVGVRELLKSFCPFSYERGPKVKDLIDSSSPCLRQISPNFWSIAWIRHYSLCIMPVRPFAIRIVRSRAR